jgi:predicted secreted protein
MYKRLYTSIFIGLGLLAVSALWAGDAATFVDLGFSANGHYYTFGQYGVESGSLKPWAELYIVDVPKNNFVSGGRLSYVHAAPIILGQDGSGALYTLLAANGSLFKKYGIDFLRQSRPLYLSMEANAGSQVDNTPIEFRDFESGDAFTASIVSLVEGTGEALKSSFFINLERTKADGSKKKYVVGTPQIKRPLIAAYRICRVMIAPQDGSMIFVIEMTKKSASGNDIRYMVEALRL